MTLTMGTGPLSASTDGRSVPTLPGGVRFAQPYPRRVRAVIGGDTVVDTETAVLLHAPDRLPALWLPRADVRVDLVPAGRLREAPDKGELAGLLEGRVHLPLAVADRWFAEDEPVYAHFKDPYHRVDVLTSSRHVVVRVEGRTIAETRRPKLLFETGLPVRYYIPWADVALAHVAISDTVSQCPYKGDGQHWHLDVGGRRIEDAAWSLPHPLPEGFAALEHIAFYPDRVELVVDGRRITD